MRTTAQRVVAVVLAVIGLALGVGGVWCASKVGSTGTATFTTTPPDTATVILTPDMLGRVDATVRVSASAARNGEIWLGVARPSDATAAIGDGRHRDVVGVDVSTGAVTTTSQGTADLSAISRGDVWHEQIAGKGRQSLTVEQANAPETVVVSAGDGTIQQVTVSYTRKAWFVQAVIAALIGLFLVIAGALLWRLRLGAALHAAPHDGLAVPVPSTDQAAPPRTRRTSPLSKVPWPGYRSIAGRARVPEAAPAPEVDSTDVADGAAELGTPVAPTNTDTTGAAGDPDPTKEERA